MILPAGASFQATSMIWKKGFPSLAQKLHLRSQYLRVHMKELSSLAFDMTLVTFYHMDL